MSSYDLFVAGGINDEPLVWPLGGGEWSLEHHQTWVREPSTGYCAWTYFVNRRAMGSGCAVDIQTSLSPTRM